MAMERFARMVALMGGPSRVTREGLPAAPVVAEVLAEESGVVSAFDGEALGLAVVRLGGGRVRETDPVDPRWG
jgi:thymidine phosphorylase